jgi:ATP-dependent Clp protease ATP-binding subunit ClpA
MIAQELEVALHMAFVDARHRRHRVITIEHLLLAVIDTPSAAEILRGRKVDLKELRSELTKHVTERAELFPADEDPNTQPDVGFQRVIQEAILQAQTAGVKQVTGAGVLMAMFKQKDSPAVAMLAKRGIGRSDLAGWKDAASQVDEPESVSSTRASAESPLTADLITQELETALHEAFVRARQARNEYITVEHMLLALLDTPSAAEVLRGCGAGIEDLRNALVQEIEAETPQLAGKGEADIQPTLGFQRVLQRAILHAQAVGARVTGAEALVAIFGEKDARAVLLLQRHSVTRFAVVSFLARSSAAVPATGPEAATATDLQVVLYNDDFTPMEFVVGVLEKFFGMNREEATDAMMEVHQQGAAVCGLYARETAEDLVKQVTSYATQHDHPLVCQTALPK